MSGECDTSLPALWRDTPNFQPRRNGLTPTILLMHYTGMESGKAALDLLCHKDSNVSCHYLVEEDGQIIQMVTEDARAWHAGNSCWAGEADINSGSIGIEIVNKGHNPHPNDFPDEQISVVMALAKDIIKRHSIQPRHIIGHSDVAPARKKDPGEKFPWARLHENGIGHYVKPVALEGDKGYYIGDEDAEVEKARKLLAQYGYLVEAQQAFDERDALLLTAFQRHFRPEKVDGRLDRSTLATLENLIEALPVARVS